MNLSQVESEFIKIKKCIKSVTHAGQIPSCENLISLFQKKHFEDEMDNVDEMSMESEIKTLEKLIEDTKEKFL
jgi:hypothetical protein